MFNVAKYLFLAEVYEDSIFFYFESIDLQDNVAVVALVINLITHIKIYNWELEKCLIFIDW